MNGNFSIIDIFLQNFANITGAQFTANFQQVNMASVLRRVIAPHFVEFPPINDRF